MKTVVGMTVSKITATVVCLGLLGGLIGCGVRGPLDLPPESKAEVARTATASAGQGKPKGAAGKPHRPFILDSLLD
ncbi:MAG: lipoprotein [Pseudomonadota bacterium]